MENIIEYTVPEQLVGSFQRIKNTRNLLIVAGLAVSWGYTAVSMCIDDDLLVVLPIIMVVFIIAELLFHFLQVKVSLTVSQGIVSGTSANRKNFSFAAEQIMSVKNCGINGLCFSDSLGRKYKFFSVDNRDEICTELKKSGFAVDKNIVPDENAVVFSEPDVKLLNQYKISSAIFLLLADILMTISAIWYDASGYWGTYTTTSYYYYYGYQIPYEVSHPIYRHSWYPEEMFTTYLAIACLLVSLCVFIAYIIKANNKMSVSPATVTGVNSFGKSVKMPVEFISNASVKSFDSSIAVTYLGKTHKYFMFSNNIALAQTINEAKSGTLVADKSNKAVEMTNVQTVKNDVANSAEEIKQLKELLDMGVITQEDFDTKKKQILGL